MEQKIHIRQFALNLAKEIHHAQKRKDGKPYFTHLEAVAENALKIYESLDMVCNSKTDDIADILYLIATQHDAKEDQGYEEELYGKQLKAQFFNDYDHVVEALKILNKKNYPNYFEYIMAIKQNWFASIVKRADLKHNVSDLQEGSLKDKYRLAEYILTH